MGKVKEVLMDAEEMLVELLNDMGMTNDQAKSINGSGVKVSWVYRSRHRLM